jgi:hypothetical protein
MDKRGREMVNQTHDNNRSRIKRWRLKEDINLKKIKIKRERKMNEKCYGKKNARRICVLLDGLGFSCKVISRTKALFSLGSNEYVFLTNAPRSIVLDVVRGIGC